MTSELSDKVENEFVLLDSCVFTISEGICARLYEQIRGFRQLSNENLERAFEILTDMSVFAR